MKRKIKLLLIFFVIIALDQLSKYFFVINVCNSGVAFGFGKNITFLIPFLVLVTVSYLFLKSSDKRLRIAFSLILAGGVSNLIDRAFFGCVRDFISLMSFPVFNLADASITLGVIVAVYFMMKSYLR